MVNLYCLPFHFIDKIQNVEKNKKIFKFKNKKIGIESKIAFSTRMYPILHRIGQKTHNM